MLHPHRLSASFFALAILDAVLLCPRTAEAKYNGGDPPKCKDCRPCCSQTLPAYSFVSLTEGNFGETYSGPEVRSAFGAILKFDLIYNSYNADGSRSSIDTVLGYGWTHTYNDFLFSQRGDMFRMGPDGRITRYALSTNGNYVTSTGYFESLVNNHDGSFTITTKYQTKYRYESIPGTHFLVDGPVLRLTSTTDRNNNTTSLTYVGGDLASICDTYNRCLILGYNATHHVTSVTDPLGRVTGFSYDSTGLLLATVTDPIGKTTSYTYNFLYQLTSKTDRDGRKFTVTYRNGLPFAERDSAGTLVWHLTNTSNWAVDSTQLAATLTRVYIPSMTSRTDGRANVWKYSYDSHGFPLSIVAPDGATTTYTYDPATLKVASIKDANGNTTSFLYDSEGNLRQRKDPPPFNYVTTYTYDPVFNQMTSMTDPNGRTTTYEIDAANGNRLKATDPLGGSETWIYDSHGNVLTHTDKNGNTTTYSHDLYGNLLQRTDALSEVTKYTYDIMGNMTSMTDADGNTTNYQYDALYRRILQTDALGDMMQYSYDGEGDRTKVIDENGHAVSYAYDSRRRLVTETDAVGNMTTYVYDGNNNRLSVTDRNGHTTTHSYDVQNRVITTTDALGHSMMKTYDAVGNVISTTDANGHTATSLYDALNRRTEITDALSETTLYGYDLRGLPGCPACTGPTLGSSHITKQTDANGKVIYYAYDGLDRLIIEIHKQGGTAYVITASDAVTRYTYDAMSNRTSMTEPDENTTTYSYDVLNREIKTVNAAGDTTNTTYDPAGNINSITAPNLNNTVYIYDPLNRPVQESDSQGLVTTTSYDAVGNVLSRKDGNGNGPAYIYDPLDRMITMTDALGKPTHYSYDPVGNQLNIIDRNGNTTQFTYDAINRRIAMTDAQPATTQYKYDNVGNLIKLTDANGHATSYTYDAVNRRISERYPDPIHNTITYTYDAVGNRISRMDQKGQATTYTYSDLYFLLERTYPVSPPDVFTYDHSGRVLTAIRGSWLETFAYDGANRVTRSVQNDRTISYVYNIPAHIRIVTYPGGRSITERMDFRNHLSTVNDDGMTPIAQYTYDAGERELTRGYRNGTVANYTYNANNWVLSLTHMMGANLIVGFTYAFDDEGNKQYEQKLHEKTHSEGYGYDSVYRLIDYQVGTLVGSTITMVITQTAYDLDLLGNWNSKNTDGIIQTRTHSPSNEIKSIDMTNIVSDYDGNTSNDGTSLYSYDEENRLMKVVDKVSQNTLALYQYDAFGRRVSKIDNFGVQTLYYHDGWRTIEEQSSVGLTEGTYTYGNYLDEALTMDRGGQTFYYHQNTLWSVFALSDSTGTGIEGYSYDAYGYQTVILPGLDGILDFDADDVYLLGAKSFYGNPFLFTGQRYDPEVALLYYKGRHQSSSFGRFLQRDRLRYADGMNLYEYVRGRPTFATDPLGTLHIYMVRKCFDSTDPACKCGDRPGIIWKFVLDNPAPCDGYIVQKVNLGITIKNCDNCPAEGSTGDSKPYYESWKVTKNATSPDKLREGDREGDSYDAAWQFDQEGTCGVVTQPGTIKFFCRNAAEAPPAGAGNVDGAGGTGDLGGYRTDPASPNDGWKVGNTYADGHQAKRAGTIPATENKPDWWDKRPVEGPAERNFTNWWCCCPNTTKQSKSDGSPQTEAPAPASPAPRP